MWQQHQIRVIHTNNNRHKVRIYNAVIIVELNAITIRQSLDLQTNLCTLQFIINYKKPGKHADNWKND